MKQKLVQHHIQFISKTTKQTKKQQQKKIIKINKTVTIKCKCKQKTESAEIKSEK